MPFVVMIRRFVRLDREQEFLSKFHADISEHPDFMGETLTKLSDDSAIPETMCSLFQQKAGCLTYVNIAKWKTWGSFVNQCTMTKGWFDPEIETAARERVVLEILVEVPPN